MSEWTKIDYNDKSTWPENHRTVMLVYVYNGTWKNALATSHRVRGIGFTVIGAWARDVEFDWPCNDGTNYNYEFDTQIGLMWRYHKLEEPFEL